MAARAPAPARVDDAPPRYRMLETLREYGIEQLAQAGTVTEVRRAHARFFRDSPRSPSRA